MVKQTRSQVLFVFMHHRVPITKQLTDNKSQRGRVMPPSGCSKYPISREFIHKQEKEKKQISA